MQGHEKRANEIKLRLTDSELQKAAMLANLDDRTLTDYLHHVISLHLFGHASKLPECDSNSHAAMRG